MIETSGLALAEAAGAGLRLARDPHPHDGRRRADGDRRARRSPPAALPTIPQAVARQRAADPALDHDNPLEEVFADQLACADLVILNKTDLIGAGRAGRARAAISRRSCGPGCELRRRARRQGAAARWRSASPPRPRTTSPRRPSLHELEGEHDHDDFESFVVTPGPVADGAAFRRAPAAAIAHARRAAGQRLCRRARPRPPRRSSRRSATGCSTISTGRGAPARRARRRLVVIGEKGLDRAAIAAALGG